MYHRYLYQIIFPVIMKACYFLFFLFISSVSFAQQNTHADELIYYTTIVKQFNEITTKVQSCWNQLQDVIIATQKNSSHVADAGAVSELRSASVQNINELNRAIRMISALSETDNDNSLRQQVSDFLADIKATQESAIPGIAAVLLRGTDKMTAQETNMMKTFISKGRDLQRREKEFQNTFSSYRFRHNITADELQKYVL